MPADGSPERVALSTKLFYGCGSVAEGAKVSAFNTFLLFYYNQVLGLPGTLTGAAIFVALCIDAITDPLMGAVSDGFHSRWGRRHPFMYAAALPMALCLFALFNPPHGLVGMALFAWLTVFAVGVRVSMTLYAIPSSALLPELTENYDERTSLVSYRFLFGWMGGLAVAQMGYLVFLAPSEEYADGRLDPAAYGAFAGACALLVFGAILICALGTHRLIPTLRSPTHAEALTPRRFAREVRQVLANRAYQMLLVAGIFAAVAGGFTDVVGLYMNTYFWEFSTGQIALLVYGLVISALLAFALTRPLTERFDKKQSALGLAAFAIFWGPLPVILRLLGWFPPNGAPVLLPMIWIHGVMLVTAVVAIGITVASMIADVVDESELDTGERQEGMFMSTVTFAQKATSGIGGLLAGVALDLIAFPKQSDPGSVDPDKIFALGVVVGPGVIVLYLVTLVFLARYPITRSRHLKTLAELERRQAADAG
jgi:Na+/melibiose symporter-like transporter